MVKNESTLDRFARVVVGLILLGLVVVGPRTPWGLLGLVPLITGFIGVCPLYSAFNFSSNHKGSRTRTGSSSVQ